MTKIVESGQNRPNTTNVADASSKSDDVLAFRINGGRAPYMWVDGAPPAGVADCLAEGEWIQCAYARPHPLVAAGVTDEIVEQACRAYYNSGVPVHPPVFEGMRAALRAALAHPRPTGDVPRYTHLPVDLWEAIAKNSVWLMRNARDGHYTLDQAIEYQLGAIATGRDPAPTGEQAGEVVPYTAEVVAEVVRGDDGQNELSFLVEGAEAALEVGEVLYTIGGLPTPDDGSMELHLAQPRPMGVPDGWKLVPLKSTDEMHRAYTRKKYEDREGKPPLLIPELWEALLAAAPAPGKGGEA